MNRGSKNQQELANLASSSFNEAPIHESGKYDEDSWRQANPALGFNEAPIHESGKYFEEPWQTTMAAELQ